MTNTAERRDQVGAFFAAHADRLRRAVRRRAAGVSDAIVDDACQIAWTTLLRRPDITLNRSGLGWLTKVAVHEAWQQGAAADEIASQAELPELIDRERRGTEDKVLDRLEHRERVEALHVLKPAEREALYLKGLGYTYEEIMRLTGASYTAVNRRITEGRAALRRELGEDSGPRRWAQRRAADAPAARDGGEDRSAAP